MTKSHPDGQINRQEADAIVTYIANHFASNTRQTIGVITTNRAQKNYIERNLKTHLGQKNHAGEEPIFVRTTQEVQGEERDIILISTVYDGRDPNLRFGVFEKDGGLERLNVMLSRSRSEMIIFTSFRDETPFDPLRTEAKKGRYAFRMLHTLIKELSDAETKLRSSQDMRKLARRFSMKVENLGIVSGLRYDSDLQYRLGVVLTNNTKDAAHWTAIGQQLQAKGWRTLNVAENEILQNPTNVQDQINEALTKRPKTP